MKTPGWANWLARVNRWWDPIVPLDWVYEPLIGMDINPNAYIFDEIMKLQNEKNAMYGNSFEQSLDEFGEVAGASQLMHKFNRYKTLVKKTTDNTAESKRDTLIDILGYTAMLIAWGDKQQTELEPLPDENYHPMPLPKE